MTEELTSYDALCRVWVYGIRAVDPATARQQVRELIEQCRVSAKVSLFLVEEAYIVKTGEKHG